MSSLFKQLIKLSMAIAVLLLTGCAEEEPPPIEVSSPDSTIKVIFETSNEGMFYRVVKDDKVSINNSQMGYRLRNDEDLFQNFAVENIAYRQVDDSWQPVWGQRSEIRNQYNEMAVYLREKNSRKRKMTITFRVFNDGLGFRYHIPPQPGVQEIQVSEELTEFALPEITRAHWIPAYGKARYEYLYEFSPVHSLGSVHTPLTMETDNNYISIHEAALMDYPSMVLSGKNSNVLAAELVPWPDGVKVYAQGELLSPWRTIQIADKPTELAESNMILNLNEPSDMEDTSWIKPGKYVGIWWGMHLGKYSFGSGPKHGATTERTKQYIDFAAMHGFDGVLVEGWNKGWDGKWWQDGSNFEFTTEHPDFDMNAVSQYAREKGVYIVGHHETGAAASNYEKQLEEAFTFYNKHGVKAVKTGHVGPMLDGKYWHHGQYGVRHYQKIVDIAAKNRVMLNMHEPIKDTGLTRTYPHLLTREGARGQEFNAWDKKGGNDPAHTTILPFTRMLSGPMDFTPGIFELELKSRPKNQVPTTLAKQLALYVVIYSPFHMAADLPQNYKDHPALQFIKDVPVDWSETRFLEGKIGDHVTVARKDKNSEDWYLGAITDEKPRELKLSLSFLDKDKRYNARVYSDGKDAHWKTNPGDYQITNIENLSASSEMDITITAGGGVAVKFTPIDQIAMLR